MKIPVWLVLSVLPVLHAEEVKEAAPVAAPEAAAEAAAAEAAAVKPSAEEILKQLVTTAKEELEISNKAPKSRGWTLGTFFEDVEREQANGGFRSTDEARAFFQGIFPSGDEFTKSKALAKAYENQLAIEVAERKKQFEEECVRSLSALMKRAVETQEPEKLERISQEVDEFFRDAAQKSAKLDERGQFRSSPVSSDQSPILNLVSQLSNFHAQRLAEKWGTAASSLQTLRRSFPRFDRYLPEKEATAFIANCEKSIGLLSPEDSQRLLESTLAEILDDQNQDRLDDFQGTIRKQLELSRNSPRTLLSQKWQNLSELATGFSQNIKLMKQGGPPQFTTEQWFRANPDTAGIISRDKLTEAMKRYRVRMTDESGKVLEEPIYYDMNEVIARIQTPADIAREMPVFQKAVKQASYSSNNVNWQNLGQRLQQYADMFAKLESGVSFAIGGYSQSEYGYERSNNPVVEDVATRKSADLNQQLQWMIVRRFLPETSVDASSTPAKVVVDRFSEAKKGNDYQAMLTLGRLSGYLTQGQGLLSPQDALALQCYLDGVKQEEQLDQPRLATFYFQRAAAVPNSPIPPSVFKARLKTLKRNAPKDYEKGTDDALVRNLDSSVMGMYAPLMVPEKPTAEKVPGGR